MRYVFRPPADVAAGLLTLPWQLPLEEWQDERLVEIRHRGTSRHVVRFVTEQGRLYALKEMNEPLARREYRLLRRLSELGIPAVEPLGIVVDRGTYDGVQLDAVLCTCFLEYSTTYRTLYSDPHRLRPTDRLLDALVELLVRLHLAGFFWGDCSLSNTLFRLDAGALQAIFVDAETSELHPSLTDGQRGFDVELASERVGGELLDLAAAGLLPPDVEPVELAEEIPRRYQQLWDALTEDVIIRPEEQRYRMTERLRRLNDLGFDADEVELVSAGEGFRLRIRTRVAEPGHHRHRLRMLTGLDVQENQARRLLNDIASYRGYLEEKEGQEGHEHGGRQPMVAGRLRQGAAAHASRAGRPAITGRGLPSGPRAQVVPVRAGWARRGHDRGRSLLLRRGPPHGARAAGLGRDGRTCPPVRRGHRELVARRRPPGP